MISSQPVRIRVFDMPDRSRPSGSATFDTLKGIVTFSDEEGEDLASKLVIFIATRLEINAKDLKRAMGDLPPTLTNYQFSMGNMTFCFQ